MDTQTETQQVLPWLPIGTLYLAGMLQGLTLVSFPASSGVLKQMHGFSDAQYGAIFLPQLALAGLACPAFFPLSIGFASQRFDKHVPWVSSMLIAALMVGAGLGSSVIGLLRDAVAMEQLYRLSTFYPVMALLLGFPVLRRRRTVVGVALKQ